MRYWIYVEKASYGPYEVEELRGVARFTPETMVCPEGAVGGKDWLAAAGIGELKALFDTPPERAKKLPEPKPEALKPCPNCKESVPTDSIFCSKCGAKLTGAAPATSAPSSVSAPPMAAPEKTQLLEDRLEKAFAAARPPEESPPPADLPPVAPPVVKTSPLRQWALPVGIGAAAIAGIFIVMPRLVARRAAPPPSPPPAVATLPAPVRAQAIAKAAPAPAPASPRKARYPKKVKIIAKAKKKARRVLKKKAAGEPDDAALAALIDGQEGAAHPEYDSLLSAGKPETVPTPSSGELDKLLEKPKNSKPLPAPAPGQEFILPGIPKPSAKPNKGQCSEPGFYTSLSEDPDWYYGVAKAADAAQARNLAVDNLSSRVKGEIAVGFEEADIEAIAGPGRDRVAVSDAVAQLLPAASVLADRAQDVYSECDGKHYAMVRSRKDKIHQFMKQDPGFRSALADRLGKR